MSSLVGLDGRFSCHSNHSTYYYDRSLSRIKRKSSLLCDRVKLKRARLRLGTSSSSRLGRTLNRPYFVPPQDSETTLTGDGANVDGNLENSESDLPPPYTEFVEPDPQPETSNGRQNDTSSALVRRVAERVDHPSSTRTLPSSVPVEGLASQDTSSVLRYNYPGWERSCAALRLPTIPEQIYLKPSHMRDAILRTGSFSSRTLTKDVQLAEKVAAAKMYFEFYYRNLESNKPGRGTSLRQLRLLKARQAKGEQEVLGAIGFNVIQEIGKGSFGIVRLVRQTYEPSFAMDTVDGALSRSTSNDPHSRSKYFAMKTIRKTSSLITAQEAHLRCERDVLVRAAKGCRWIVKLHCAFQDENSLHLVMDFEMGGDFLQLLIRVNKLNEESTQFYIAEMVLAVEETHRLGIVHRDLKPDNFLISAKGHLRLADFGLAYDGEFGHTQKFYSDKRRDMLGRLEVDLDALDSMQITGVAPSKVDGPGSPSQVSKKRLLATKLPHSLVGTSQYMAPEVLLNAGYDGRCDWWSVGVMLFECLFAYTPFSRENREATKRAVVRHREEFVIPRHVDMQPIKFETEDLIRKLITDRPFRLGGRKYTHSRYSPQYVVHNDASEIKEHKFFEELDWSTLHLMPAPWIPGLRKDRHTRPGTDLFPTPPEGQSSSDGSTSAAKDPILRDKRFSTAVMHVRKNNAFLGYEWNGSLCF